MAQPAVSRKSAPRQQLHQSSAGSVSHAAAPSTAQMQQEAIAEASSRLLAADATDQGATCKGRSRTSRPRRGTQVTHEGSTFEAAKPRPRRQAAGSTKVAKTQSSSAMSISRSTLASGSASAVALDMEPSATAGSGGQQVEEGPGSSAAPAKLSGSRQAKAGNTWAGKQLHVSSTCSSSTPTSSDVAALADPLDKDSAAPASDCEQPPEQLTVNTARRPAARRMGSTAFSKAAAGTSRRDADMNQEQRLACQQAAASKSAAGSNSGLPTTSRQGCERACPPAAVSPVTQTQPRTRMSR